MLIKQRNTKKHSNGYYLNRNGLRFFYIGRDSLTRDDSKVWRLTSFLPGYEGKSQKFETVDKAIEKANDLLEVWMTITDFTIRRVSSTKKFG